MPAQRALTLIAPRLLLNDARQASERAEFGRLLRRGVLTRLELRAGDAFAPMQREMLRALGLAQQADAYAPAAVMAAAAADRLNSDVWLSATPLHFAAGMDSLAAVLLSGEHALQRAERAELGEFLSPHLAAAGFELHIIEGEWLLKSAASLAVNTVSPETAAANPLATVMPSGPDARALRRLMTELQMLLHEHPVNANRSRAGRLQANAVWLHGAGVIKAVERASLPAGYGDDLFLRGLYRLHAAECAPAPRNAAALLHAVRGDAVAVIDVERLDDLENEWLSTVSRALRRGGLQRFELSFDRWRICVDRAAFFKFWRWRKQALWQFPSDSSLRMD